MRLEQARLEARASSKLVTKSNSEGVSLWQLVLLQLLMVLKLVTKRQRRGFEPHLLCHDEFDAVRIGSWTIHLPQPRAALWQKIHLCTAKRG